MKAQPYVCLPCRSEPEAYFGRLVFPDETDIPTCPNHRKEDGTVETVLLVPANTLKESQVA